MQDGAFEAALRSDGYNEVVTTVAPHAPPTPEHTHPFDVRALVLEGAITLTAEGLGRARFSPWTMAGRMPRPSAPRACAMSWTGACPRGETRRGRAWPGGCLFLICS